MNRRLVFGDIEQFYFVSRLCLVKDEKYYDRFDVAFGDFFGRLDAGPAFESEAAMAVLRDVVHALYPRLGETALQRLEDEYREAIDALRARNELTARERDRADRDDETDGSRKSTGDEGDERGERGERDEKQGREREGEGEDGEDGEGEGEGEDGDGEDGEGEDGEQGEGEEGREGEGGEGEKGVGTGEEPGDGERDELEAVSMRTATKVWQMRQFEDYDPEVELGTRNIKMALRRLRKFARTAAELELDLPGTISATARNGGILDVREIPERHNAVKVLLLLDVGGSMDEHIELCAQLFSAARSEFKYLEYFYFHNFIYESVWDRNERRGDERIPTFDILNKYGSDYKIIFVGDASMARHEVAEKGGSVEHYNSEPGEVWLARFHDRFRKVVWLNPVNPAYWDDSYSITMIRRLMSDQMYHLSVDGIERAMKFLAR